MPSVAPLNRLETERLRLRSRVAGAEGAGHRRLRATVWDWNAPSLRVLEKLGFVDTGEVNPETPHGRTRLLVWEQ